MQSFCRRVKIKFFVGELKVRSEENRAGGGRKKVKCWQRMAVSQCTLNKGDRQGVPSLFFTKKLVIAVSYIAYMGVSGLCPPPPKKKSEYYIYGAPMTDSELYHND